jgi:tetratricopeptide (TPR) repeat protein
MPPRTGASRETTGSLFRSVARVLSPAVLDGIMTPADGQNRIVTAVASRLSGSLDAESAAPLLEALIEVLSRCEGRIDRFLDDGPILVFGTPLAHEDDPERAIRFALDLGALAGQRGLQAASGIGTGSMAFGMVDPDEHHESGVPGPVLLRAVRLLSRARAGEILVDGDTWQQAHRSFDGSEVAEADHAYLVGGSRPRPQKVRGLDGVHTPLVGRDEELARLLDSFDEVARGTGRFVSIAGDAGIGKSRLVVELKDRVLPGSSTYAAPLWLEGRCVESGADIAYGPFVDLLNLHFDIAPGRETLDRATRVVDALGALRRDGALSGDRVDEVGPLLGRLLSIRFDTSWDTALVHAQAEQVRHQTILALRDLLIALARERPLVVVLDDLHWADPLSLDVISMLMESLAAAPVLLVCLYRPEHGRRCNTLPTIAAHACPGCSTDIVLTDLDPTEGLRLIRCLLAGGELPPRVSESILARSQGNPFFLEEVIRSLIDTGAISRENERWRAGEDAAAAAVPRTLQRVILSRVDRLGTANRQLLETAAVIGASFDRRVLELAAGGPSGTTVALDDLVDRALIVPAASRLGGEYAFKHVLTQQAVYLGTHRHRRGRLHGRVAAAIESLFAESIDQRCELLAHHHEQAGNTESAVGYLVKAGARARDAFLNDAAAGYHRHALEVLDASAAAPSRSRLDVLVGLGGTLETMGLHERAAIALREAVALCGAIGCPVRETAQIRYSLGRVVTTRHRPEEYVPIGEETLAMLGGDPGCAEAAWSELLVAYGAFERGDPGPMCRVGSRRRDVFRSVPYTPRMADDCAAFAMVNLLDKNETEALDWLEWVEREAGSHSDLLSLAATHVRWGRDLFAQQGDRTHAIEAIARAIEIHGRIGARYHEARCHLYAGDVYYRFGMLEAAEASLAKVVAIGNTLEGHEHLRAERELLAGQIAMSRGDAHLALAYFRAALDRAPGDQWRWFLQLLIGCTLLERGENMEAARAFLAVLESTLAFRAPPAYSVTVDLAYVLSLLESCDDEGEDFAAARDMVRESRPESHDLLGQWHLAPAKPGTFTRAPVEEGLLSPPGPEWMWCDPFGDSTHRFANGLVIAAGPGRGLRGPTLGAPRLVRSVAGDFAFEATTSRTTHDGPAVGGLLAWKDARNHLRLDRGSSTPRTITFGGCIANRDVNIGRGNLLSEAVHLRLERSGSAVRALCSANGTEWFTVGGTEFPVEDPIKAGVFADGAIRPEVYPRTFRGGTEIRFTDFTMMASG